jgi:hypothetical protein
MSEESNLVRASEEHAAAQLPQRAAIAHRHSGGSRRSSPYSGKFIVATAALAGIALAAIIVAVIVLVSAKSSAPSVPWSAWSPPDSGLAGEREIADEIAPLYRANPASQLAIVTVHNISATSTAEQLALRDPNSGSLGAISGNSAIYTMCGLGPSCAISTGTPSTARLLLLRREALELALYTFKYINGVDNVVAVLPPGHTEAPARLTRTPPAPGKTATMLPVDLAVVFQRAGLTHLLSQPLHDTLPEPLPPSVGEMSSAPEAELVSVITGQALFTQQTIQSQDGTRVLVLNPIPPQ